MTNQPHDADVAFIQALAELLRENDLTELRVKRDYGENDSLDVRVSKMREVVTQVQAAPAPSAPSLHAPYPPDTPGARPVTEDPAAHPGAVTSPMVGTAYLQAEPGSAPFVKVGDVVSEGQTLLIVEAMKTMNHIPAPASGTVRQILVDDGTPVEFGAPLMIVE